jgi:tetratricopeptide (TPR) repeat protein
MLLIMLITSLHSSNLSPTPVREADATCERCHAKIVHSYLATPMANASGLAIEKLRLGTFVHSGSGMEYKISLSGDHGEFRYRSLNVPGDAGGSPLNYFLGSGHLGTTYLYTIGDFLFESPIAWYAPSQSYDMKPGLAEMDRMPPPLPMLSGCMRCHMSAVQPSDEGTINRYRGLPFLHSGITCEACHGESSQHIATNGKAGIMNPAKLAPEPRDSICISCHLEGDITVQRSGHPALNYRPGESISTYLTYYVRAGANLTDRAVSEVEQLSQSKCKRTTGDQMSCMSCHDPHYTPDETHKVAYFRGKCLACHNRPEFATTHHPENPDCTSCHMPQTGARNVLHVAWTDHRIRKNRADSPIESSVEPSGTLTPIFSPGASSRDEAMANYQALLEGDRSLEPAVWQQLNAEGNRLRSDKEALDALGNISAERSDWAKGESAFRRVLEIDSADLTALSNLGILLAKEGKLKEAEAMLQQAFDRNQDLPGLAKNLARVQCMAGDEAAARSTLTTALIYCPHVEDVRQLLQTIRNCGPASGK